MSNNKAEDQEEADEDLSDELLTAAEELCHICNEVLDSIHSGNIHCHRMLCCGIAFHKTCIIKHTDFSMEKCFHCKKKTASDSKDFERIVEWEKQNKLWAIVMLGTV